MTATNETATAHVAWEQAWRDADRRADWIEPEPEVVDIAKRMLAEGRPCALDLGCGIGRHALALARLGLDVTALDASGSGLAELRRVAAQDGLEIDIRNAGMTEIPMEDATLDYVLSWNVIYHGDPDIVAATIAEITRILKPGGIDQGTMLTKRNRHFGVGHEIARDTWIDEAGEGDKAHPHFYCDVPGLWGLFEGFEFLSLRQSDQGKPEHWHWHLVLEKTA